jgi:hypothetical protein
MATLVWVGLGIIVIVAAGVILVWYCTRTATINNSRGSVKVDWIEEMNYSPSGDPSHFKSLFSPGPQSRHDSYESQESKYVTKRRDYDRPAASKHQTIRQPKRPAAAAAAAAANRHVYDNGHADAVDPRSDVEVAVVVKASRMEKTMPSSVSHISWDQGADFDGDDGMANAWDQDSWAEL